MYFLINRVCFQITRIWYSDINLMMMMMMMIIIIIIIIIRRRRRRRRRIRRRKCKLTELSPITSQTL